MQLSLKMEPSTHGAGEAMGDWGMVNLCAKQLYTIKLSIVLYTGMYMYMCDLYTVCVCIMTIEVSVV